MKLTLWNMFQVSVSLLVSTVVSHDSFIPSTLVTVKTFIVIFYGQSLHEGLIENLNDKIIEFNLNLLAS